MKRLLKWLTWGVGSVVALVVLVVAVAWWHSEQGRTRQYAIDDPPLSRSSSPEVLARGEHLFHTLACAECHGDQGQGGLVMDAGPVMRAVAPNLTQGHLPAGYDVDAIAAAVRHGVRANGQALVFMPAASWTELDDADMTALASYVLALPGVANDPGATELRPLGRVLNLLGALDLFPAEQIDHTPRTRQAPEAIVSVDYGRYLAGVCMDCHGANLQGGKGFGPENPLSSNLTPHADGLGGWQEADFQRALREGVRPDGSSLHPIMPWRATARMSDTELAALWVYLRSVPPLPDGP
ncbi:MAG: c-type cytochrome [Xanthomonadales bacterium]|nr:c-type cytochrome [Xanthomonadales bacterium]